MIAQSNKFVILFKLSGKKQEVSLIIRKGKITGFFLTHTFYWLPYIN
jgi:hypothetical protein